MPATTTNPAFSPGLAASLAAICELTYVQYQKGLADPSYDGSIKPPPGFVQTASFKAPEIDLGSRSRLLAGAHAVDLTDKAALDALAIGLQEVYFGFALQPAPGVSGPNVLALRGTQSPEEWIADLSAFQVPVPLVWFNHDKFQVAKAHLGFLVLYGFLFDQILAAARQFNTSRPCFATGHSLGHALAVFSAATVDVEVYDLAGFQGQVQTYSFAGPRVGDPIFRDAYDFLIPSTFRVVNLSDVVPVVPPSSIGSLQYAHVGQEWSYLFQTGNIDTNHSLVDNYLPAVSQPKGPVETDAPRTYPTSGL